MSIRKVSLVVLSGLAIALVFLVSACGNTSNTPPTPQSGTVGVSNAGTAPIVVLSPTTTLQSDSSPTANTPTSSNTPSSQPQFVALADRALALGQVSKGPGADSSSTAISITVTIKNTSTASIKNQATFYQLIGAEGDTFGTQSSVTSGFYSAIAPGQERTGTIVFQVPTGAVRGLRLLFRPEVATDTLLLPLRV